MSLSKIYGHALGLLTDLYQLTTIENAQLPMINDPYKALGTQGWN